jgi:hypothetical protein
MDNDNVNDSDKNKDSKFLTPELTVKDKIGNEYKINLDEADSHGLLKEQIRHVQAGDVYLSKLGTPVIVYRRDYTENFGFMGLDGIPFAAFSNIPMSQDGINKYVLYKEWTFKGNISDEVKKIWYSKL